MGNRIKEIRQSQRMSMEALATLAETTAPTINKLEKGQMRLSDRWLAPIAKALHVQPSDLIEQQSVIFKPADHSDEAKSIGANHGRLADIPVYGLAAGSITGSQKLGDEPIQYVTRPPGLHTVKDAYAMMVTGTSMEPRYFAGEIIFLHPHRPPRTGDHVAIQEMVNGDTRTWIKRFEKLTEDHLITTQYNPAIEVKYSRKYIAAVHRVMTPNELMGI